jgi:hypothetical protein
MSKFRVPREGEALLDIVSYGRGGPRENGGRLTPEQVEQIRRTVQRVPEVMVKVLSRASNDLNAAGKHVDYIGRYGELALETDDFDHVENRNGRALMEDWDLDIDDARRQSGLAAIGRRQPPKLIHKLMFSMPSGTPPEKVLTAVRNFAREEFWGQHRYVFVLHTDEDHPHVHLVLKAVNEQGVRLNIKKGTLRHWRAEFARNLRLLGEPANATERAVRGEVVNSKKDGIYRASLRGDSTHFREQAEAVVSELQRGKLQPQPGSRRLSATRAEVVGGWRAVAERLAKSADHALSADVRRFADQMPPPQTDRESLAMNLLRHMQRNRERRAILR